MLIGNVGKDPEVRYLESNPQNPGNNAKVASFPLATSERYRDRNGEQRENTEWHNIVVWRGNADVVEKYVHKGTQLYIEGKLRTRQWTDQTGSGSRYLAASGKASGWRKPAAGRVPGRLCPAVRRSGSPAGIPRRSARIPARPVGPSGCPGSSARRPRLPGSSSGRRAFRRPAVLGLSIDSFWARWDFMLPTKPTQSQTQAV